MRLDLILTMCCFFAMFISVMTKVNKLGLHRPLVLLRHTIGGYSIPYTIEKEKNNHNGNKPYHFVGGKTYYFCPSEIVRENGAKHEEYGCLIGKIYTKENDAYYCEKPIEPIANSLGKCELNNRSGILYEIGYKYCNQAKIFFVYEKEEFECGFLTLYKFCYDHEQKRTLYVDYEMYPLALLYNDAIDLDEKLFTTELTSSQYMITFETDFEEMKTIIGQKQEHEEEEKPKQEKKIEPELLAPGCHFPFVQLKRPLFHYSNSILIQKYLSSLFRTTYNFIQRLIGEDDNQILAVPFNTYYGETNTSTYSPQAIAYLITKKKKYGIAFILHNEPETNDNDQQFIPQQCSPTVPCTTDEKNVESWLNNKDLKINLAYCCDINDIMEKWNFHPFDEKKNLSAW